MQIHVAPVFAPARIQENTPGKLFMYWFRAKGVFGIEKFAPLWGHCGQGKLLNLQLERVCLQSFEVLIRSTFLL